MIPTILIVDDEPRYRALYAQVLKLMGVAVMVASDAAQALTQIERCVPSLVISDVRMPGDSGLELLQAARERWPQLPFLLVTAYADVREAVAALKLGAVDYLAKPVDLDELVACVQDTLGLSAGLDAAPFPESMLEGVIAASPAMRAIFDEAWYIARSDVNVLITGESGTGKEVIARFIHRCSERAEAPCVAINCAALPASLLASELFGHEKGAFTGATSARKGRFREANGGVLFLDEIGDMPMELQPVFLRALEQRKISPVGATGEVEVDFRLIAATNRALEDDVAAGLFRADLFYRLNVVELHMPPLRERVDDILPLARYFLGRAGGQDKRIGRATARALQAHSWPGNVRELENAMERARLLTRTDVILPESLPPAIRASSSTPQPIHEPELAILSSSDEVMTLKDAEIESLRKALEMTQGNRTHAAELLGITRRGLLKKLKRFDL